MKVLEQEIKDIEFALQFQQEEGKAWHGGVVLEVMEAVEVAFVSKHSDHACHFIPSLLPTSPDPHTAQQRWLPQSHDGAVVMGACVLMDHIPTALVGRVLVRCNRLLGSEMYPWRHGAVVHIAHDDGVVCRVLVSSSTLLSDAVSSSPMLSVLAFCHECPDEAVGMCCVFCCLCLFP